MVNILVPTDLSEVSKVAADYAIKMANRLEANVTLVHVITVVVPIRSDLQKRLKSYEENLILRTTEEIKASLKNVVRHAKFAAPVQYHVAIGAPFSTTLQKEAKKLHTGLIVMGTLGASGIKKVVLGSNTASMIAESPIPILAVPGDAEFRGLTNVVYASDMKNLKKELKALIPYAAAFGSAIHVVHVIADATRIDAIEEKMSKAIEQSGYGNICGIVLVDENIDDAIIQYASINKADLLAMFTHKPTFYERLFDKSVTRRMAFHSKVPLIAFKHV